MTDWEDHYRTGETPWDKGAPAPGLVDFLAASARVGRVLVPGCGLGHDVRALAPHAFEVIGLDIAPSAVAAASALPRTGHERYELGDLFALPAALRGAFDFVWEHTCFCAIDPMRRVDYVQAAAEALRPGGQLLGVFYLDPNQPRSADGPPFETTLHELDRLFSTRFALQREWSPAHSYPGREGREWMRLYERR